MLPAGNLKSKVPVRWAVRRDGLGWGREVGWGEGWNHAAAGRRAWTRDSGTPAGAARGGRKPAGRVLKPGAAGTSQATPGKYTQGPDVWGLCKLFAKTAWPQHQPELHGTSTISRTLSLPRRLAEQLLAGSSDFRHLLCTVKPWLRFRDKSHDPLGTSVI